MLLTVLGSATVVVVVLTALLVLDDLRDGREGRRAGWGDQPERSCHSPTGGPPLGVPVPQDGRAGESPGAAPTQGLDGMWRVR